MKLPCVALVTLSLAGQSLAQPRLDPGSYRIVTLRPVTLGDATAQFERICLAAGFESGRFDSAIRASRWKFAKEAGAGSPAPDVRRAPEAAFNFHGTPSQEPRDFAPAQCNMEAVVRPVATTAAIEAALRAALTRYLGTSPPLHQFRGETCWRWKPAPDLVDRLCRIHRPDDASGHVALSFQRWTAQGERRARLVPAAETIR